MTNFFGRLSVAEITVESGELSVGDTLEIEGPTTGVYEAVIEELRLDDASVQTVRKGGVCSVVTSAVVRRGDKVFKKVQVPDEF